MDVITKLIMTSIFASIFVFIFSYCMTMWLYNPKDTNIPTLEDYTEMTYNGKTNL